MADFMFPPTGVPGELPPMMPPPVGGQGLQLPPAPPVPQPVQPQVSPDPVAQAVTAAQPEVAKEEGMDGNSSKGVGFFDKLRTDPKLSQAMMMVGLRMMQGQRPGQDTMGMISDAMMAGATAHNMLTHNEQQQQQQDKEFALKKEQAQVNMDNTRATTAQTQQNTEFKAQLQPEELKKAKLEIARLKSDGDIAAARALGEAVKNDPELVRRQINDTHSQSMASINASNASAASSYASAGNLNETTRSKKKDAQMKEWAVSGTPEQKKQARDYFTVDDPASRSNAVKQGQVEDLIRRANPDLTDNQVAQQALDLSTSQKGERIIALKALIDNGDDTQRTAALAELNSIVLGKKLGVNTGAATGTPAGAKIITEAQISSNMAKYGKTREETLAAAKAQGYTLQGAK